MSDLDDDELRMTRTLNKTNFIFAKERKIRPLLLFMAEENIDRNNDLYTLYKILVKFSNTDDYILLYSTRSELDARIAYRKLKDISDVYLYKLITQQENYCTMFEYADQIYKTLYVFPNQSCICGENIPGNKHYGEYSVEPPKYDYALSPIFFYTKGQCVVKCNQLFLDGELLLDATQLKAVCNQLNEHIQYNNPSVKFLNYIATSYPNAVSYTCDGYSNYNIRGE